MFIIGLGVGASAMLIVIFILELSIYIKNRRDFIWRKKKQKN